MQSYNAIINLKKSNNNSEFYYPLLKVVLKSIFINSNNLFQFQKSRYIQENTK